MSVPKVIIRERKLGKEGALGIAERKPKQPHQVTIDPRQSERERLDTVIHELLHIIVKEWSEEKVDNTARSLSHYLWKQGYRRVNLK